MYITLAASLVPTSMWHKAIYMKQDTWIAGMILLKIVRSSTMQKKTLVSGSSKRVNRCHSPTQARHSARFGFLFGHCLPVQPSQPHQEPDNVRKEAAAYHRPPAEDHKKLDNHAARQADEYRERMQAMAANKARAEGIAKPKVSFKCISTGLTIILLARTSHVPVLLSSCYYLF